VGEEQFEAVSETGPVGAGMEIDVVGVQGGALVVRAVTRAAEPEALRPEAAEKSDSPEPTRLSRVLEEFEFDGLDQPKS
jgi:hypothetical protein